MAALHERNGRTVLTVAPVWPTIEGPHDAYDLTLTRDGRLLYECRHGTVEWLSGFWTIDGFARTFLYAAQLVDVSQAFYFADAPDSGVYHKPLFAHANLYWLDCFLNGFETRSMGERINVSASLRVDPDAETGLERYVWTGFGCTPGECRRFGAALLAEAQAAERRRIELGLSDEEGM